MNVFTVTFYGKWHTPDSKTVVAKDAEEAIVSTKKLFIVEEVVSVVWVCRIDC